MAKKSSCYGYYHVIQHWWYNCKYKHLCTVSFAYVCTGKIGNTLKYICLWIWKRYKVNFTLLMFRDIILEIAHFNTGYFYGAKLEHQLCAVNGLLEILNYHRKDLRRFKLHKSSLFFFFSLHFIWCLMSKVMLFYAILRKQANDKKKRKTISCYKWN